MDFQLPSKIFYCVQVWRLNQDHSRTLRWFLQSHSLPWLCVSGRCHAGRPSHGPFSMLLLRKGDCWIVGDWIFPSIRCSLSAHPRTPSPEYWTAFPISPVPRSNHLHRCSQFSPLYKQPSDSHALRSLVLHRLTLPSVYLLSIDSPCIDLWLFTDSCFLVCCLPRPLPVLV